MSQNLQPSAAKTFWDICKDLPTHWSRRHKIYSAVVFLIGLILSDSLTKGYILSLFVPYGHTAIITGGILRIVGTIVIVIPTSLIIFYKLKSYCMTDINGKRSLVIIGILVLLALFVTYSYKSIVATNDFYRWHEETRAAGNKRLLQIINNEVPIDETRRSKIDIPALTYLYAKDIYTHEGRTIEYRTAEGSMRLYTPTLEDQKMRDNLSFFRVYTDSTKVSLIIFNSLAAIAIIGALAVGLSSRRKLSNTV